MKKQKLSPLRVPWMVSSSTPFLRVFASDQPSQENTYVEFVAYYKCEENRSEQSSETGVPIVTPPAAFQVDNSAHGPYRLVRVEFESGLWVKLSPAHSDKEVVQEALFDWSEVRGRWSPGEDIYDFVKRTNEEWLRSGICHNPRIYVVEESQWLDECGLAQEGYKQWRHYLVLGHDSYAEVIAATYAIREGQVLSGW